MYYQNVKQKRATLPEPYVFVTSMKTTNGGKEGVITEVDTTLAARMIVDGSARESTPEEIAAHLAECDQLRSAAKEDELRNRLRVTLVSEPEFHTEVAKPERGPKRA